MNDDLKTIREVERRLGKQLPRSNFGEQLSYYADETTSETKKLSFEEDFMGVNLGVNENPLSLKRFEQGLSPAAGSLLGR